ncbi:lactate permease LctP family transporter [Chitinivorax sp. PXF-14]|uniref:lactate permease LctP family transporter n=1 Tax=Chitinivorax sp. PXF-14 TaxID=3230488 RepID=UPI003465E503
MELWTQVYNPLGNIWLSALVAAIPIAFFFVALTVLRWKGYLAGLGTILITLVIALTVYGMPAGLAVRATATGMAYGLWPISWIIVTAVFLYKLSVKSGQFEIIRSSVISITGDQRLQVILIGFAFGAFLEGSAGFGAPVAITAAILTALGLNPLYAAGLCLIANTAPVAFGALGIPILVAGKTAALDPMHIGQMAGRQLPLLSLFVPFFLVWLMDGFKGVRETWPALFVAGGSFAVTQYFTSNYIGPELPDITSALVSLLSLAAFLKFWQPRQAFTFSSSHQAAANPASIALRGPGMQAVGQRRTPEQRKHEADTAFGSATTRYSAGQILKAWSPFIILTAVVVVWSLPQFKALFAKDGALYASTVWSLKVPGLHDMVVKTAPIVKAAKPYEAIFKMEFLAATGSGILLAGFLTMAVLRISIRDGIDAFKETLAELAKPIFSISCVLGFAYIANYSGLSSTLALALASTGKAFPFFSPVLGWLGVFLTGSDTSSNALFSALQAITAQQIGVSDVLMVAANTTGGVTGKMISPQSIAIACAAVGLVGRESDLLRFTVKYSFFFLLIVCVITYVQAYFLSGMIPR